MFAIVDLETLGVCRNPVILSAGLVVVGDSGEIEQSIFFAFDIDSQLHAGRAVEGETLRWHVSNIAGLARWASVEPDNRDFLSDFMLRLRQLDETPLWAWGADFDIGILRDAGLYKRRSRCARTAWELLGAGKTRTPAEIPHDPLSDCMAVLANMRQLDPTLAMFHR